MAKKNLTLKVKDRIGVLTINRPKALNALNVETLSELIDAVEQIEENEEVAGAILTGAGDKAFVAGADISEMVGMDVREARDFARLGQGAFSLVENLPKPTIAVVNGYALGGGLELAMACDIILASSKAQFGQPEVKLGVIPGFGGTQRLVRRVGMHLAKELILTGSYINAERALAIGLINAIHPPDKLMDEAVAMMKKILANGPVAVELAKYAINTGADENLSVGLSIEKDVFAQCFSTEDQREGMNAFLEKRNPDFKGW